MIQLKKYFWLLSALLFGISWPIIPDINLSFLAWISFVFLFIDLRQRTGFKDYYLTVFKFLFISHLIPYWWVFSIPINKHLVLLGVFQDILFASVPYILLYFLNKKFTFSRSLLLVAFFIPVWEFIYAELENTLGFIIIGYSQGNNLSFIQSTDIWGVYGISFIVWVINILIYQAINLLKTPKKTAIYFAGALMIICLNYYYSIATQNKYLHYSGIKSEVLALNTNFAPIKKHDNYWNEIFNRISSLTDSVLSESKTKPDLIIWPESIINENWSDRKTELQEKSTSYNIAFLTGVKTTHPQTSNNMAFIEPESDGWQYYQKIKLTPFWEGIPYLSKYYNFKNYLSPGQYVKLITQNQSGETVNIGTPICFEQFFPVLWTKMSRKGAQGFIHSSYESWLGKYWFKNILFTITRFRAIENRKCVLRCSNGGYTGFIDVLGRSEITNNNSLKATMKYNSFESLFSKYPFLFQIICGLIFMVFLYRKNKIQEPGQKE